MKSVIKYSILMICFSVSILLVMDINSISQRKVRWRMPQKSVCETR